MSEEDQLKLELERLKKENDQLKEQMKGRLRAGSFSLRVSEKGAVSVYGLGRFPITLYQEQWEKLFDRQQDIKDFIANNQGQMKPGEQMKKFRFHWRNNKQTPTIGEGLTPEDAFSKLGYGRGAVAALDYYEEVKETPAEREAREASYPEAAREVIEKIHQRFDCIKVELGGYDIIWPKEAQEREADVLHVYFGFYACSTEMLIKISECADLLSFGITGGLSIGCVDGRFGMMVEF